MTLANLRIGYVPYSPALTSPGDRRRFPFYARERSIPFEIARPGEEYDLVVLSSNADVTYWADLPTGRPKLVFELIDSYLALPRHEVKSLLRGPVKFAARQTRRPAINYRHALERMARRADAIVCSTEEQRWTLLAYCDNVHTILDAHTELLGRHKEDFSVGETVNLVWEGLPHTLGEFFTIAPILRRIARERPLALHLVTDLEFPQYAGRFVHRRTAPIARRILPDVYLYQWNTHLLPSVVTACDVALIPLDLQDPFSRGKPENKLLIFWRLGMPTVTSATPAYRRAMEAAGVDLTCRGGEEWDATLRQVIEDETLRRRAGEAGRALVAREHSLERILERWDRLFESLISAPGAA